MDAGGIDFSTKNGLIYPGGSFSYNLNASGITLGATTTGPAADLSITKLASATTVNTGGAVSYNLTVANSGPDAVAGITVSDTLPVGMTWVSAGGIGWSCSGTITVTCTMGALASGSVAPIITISVTASIPGSINNTATVSSLTPDPIPANNSASAAVTVVCSSPAATITPSGLTTFCAGGSVTLTASNGNSYAWTNGATKQSITVTSSGTYNVTVTDAAGCIASSPATTVTVNPLPPATITASGSTTFCPGGNVTLTAPAGMSYLWSTSGVLEPLYNYALLHPSWLHLISHRNASERDHPSLLLQREAQPSRALSTCFPQRP